MSEQYPINVPSCIEKGSLINEPINSVLESSIDGLPNTRNRYTSETYNTSFNIQMSYNELNILLNWYHNILFRVLTFDFNNPFYNEVREYSFVSPPSSTHIGGNQFIVKFNLESAP